MDAKKALQVIAARCGRQECSSFEVISWLRRHELTEQEIAACVAYLREHRFVDDERFAMAYARDKFRFKRWGRAKIEQALRQRQLPSETIARALATLEATDVDATCLLLLRQKDTSLKEVDPYKRKAKLIRFALGRGFDFETIRRALGQLTGQDALLDDET
ncbi:MAG: RecX family transcriptional regulator [Odoribacteraceae bacterium]|jgi:regulatory protein|nr:RecX family transcriptional regulator [Odoribacteraceae bacterium]